MKERSIACIMKEGSNNSLPPSLRLCDNWDKGQPIFCTVRCWCSLLVVFNLHAGGDGEGDEAEGHDEPEEVLVADVLGDET